MASHSFSGGATALPIALLAQAIPMLTRHDLEALAERLIDHLDEQDAPTEEMEPEDDRCSAGEDLGSRESIATPHAHGTAMCDDHEMPCPDWGIDQRRVILPH